jgi:hypothetical protein
VTARAIPIAIRFLDMVPSVTIETAVKEWVGQLALARDSITRCHVTISQPQGTERTRSQVRIAISLSGREIGVTHECLNDGTQGSCAALAGAFAAMQRQLDAPDVRGHGDHVGQTA